MLQISSDQESSASFPTSYRRKSMDPVSECIHLETLPNPGSRFELLEILGTGTSAKVYLAIDKQKGNKVAVKVITNIAENLLEIESEYRVLTSVGGQSFIPEFHGAYLHCPKESLRELWFVMELCEGVPVSSLLKWQQKEGNILKEEEIAALLKMFLIVLHHLHENDIIHRDIRASNFILSPEGEVKLIDYGTCSLVNQSEGKAHACVGSPYWMAPEVIACDQMLPYTKACDIWSLGITAIELADAQPPLYDIHPVRAMFQIARNPPPMLKKLSEWSEIFKDFISECLVRNPDHRPWVAELMFHPFISKIDDATQQMTLEEHLQEPFNPIVGEKAKKILQKLGSTIQTHLSPPVGFVQLNFIVKNWHLKSNLDLPFQKIFPDDLASTDNPSEESAVDLLYHRFLKDDIYSYIGDVLIAINPRKELPLYGIKVQRGYLEKARSDNPPHIFAVADRAYQQMLHHKRSQVIILFGKCSSGKTFCATQLMNHLAFLGPSCHAGMTEKIQQLCPMLDAFGNAEISMNPNASRYLKTVTVTFTKAGKITGAIIHSKLLDSMRVTSTLLNESNFHIFYYVYEGLKSENRLAEFGLDKLSSLRYLPQVERKESADLILGYNIVHHAFRTLSFTDDEMLIVLKIIAAILLLGDTNFTSEDSVISTDNPDILKAAAKNIEINKELAEIFGKATSIREAEKKRDALVQFLYMTLFNWIVSMLNRQLSFSRLVLGDKFSVSVIDPPGFQNSARNQLFNLSANIINDFFQSYIQQLIFFKELAEYKEEDIDIPFKHDDSTAQSQRLNNLADGHHGLMTALHNATLKAISGSNEWREELKSATKESCVYLENEKIVVNHIFETVYYDSQQIVEDNIDVCHLDFISMIELSSNATIAKFVTKIPREKMTVTLGLQSLIPKLFDVMTQDFPHVVVGINPTPLSSKEETKFDRTHVVQQLRAFNLLETILIRQQGYARRLSFSEFLNRYKYLAFDFDEEVELTKDNCGLLLIRLKMDGWKMGVNKVFLKYYSEEYLSRLYETHVKKIVKVQAMARRFIIKARQGRNV